MPCVTVSAGACFGLPTCGDGHRSKVCTPVAQATSTSLGNRKALATCKIPWTTPIVIEVAVDPCRSIRHSTAQGHTHAVGACDAQRRSHCFAGIGGALGTARNAMHGRTIRTSFSSMPTTATSASAAAALEQTWVGSVEAELHRSLQPASLLVADTCRILQRERCIRCAELGEQGTAGMREHAGRDLLAVLLGRISAESAAGLGRDVRRFSERRHSLFLLAHPD
jgi:hypothetical protein